MCVFCAECIKPHHEVDCLLLQLGACIGLGEGSIDWRLLGPWGWRLPFSKFKGNYPSNYKDKDCTATTTALRNMGGGESWRKLMFLVAL